MGAVICHKLNVLHVYCRLRDLHIPKWMLIALKLYEILVHRLVYQRR